MRKERCGDCKYWMPDDNRAVRGDHALGECRRFPRTQKKCGMNWCGEFKLWDLLKGKKG